MSRRSRRNRERHDSARPGIASSPIAAEFSAVLEDNEQHMGEHAAMAVTCEQFGITVDEGFDLLIADGEVV